MLDDRRKLRTRYLELTNARTRLLYLVGLYEAAKDKDQICDYFWRDFLVLPPQEQIRAARMLVYEEPRAQALQAHMVRRLATYMMEIPETPEMLNQAVMAFVREICDDGIKRDPGELADEIAELYKETGDIEDVFAEYGGIVGRMHDGDFLQLYEALVRRIGEGGDLPPSFVRDLWLSVEGCEAGGLAPGHQ